MVALGPRGRRAPKLTRGQEELLSKSRRPRLQQGESKWYPNAIPSRAGPAPPPDHRRRWVASTSFRALHERRAELEGRARPPDKPGIHSMTRQTRGDDIARCRQLADADRKSDHVADFMLCIAH